MRSRSGATDYPLLLSLEHYDEEADGPQGLRCSPAHSDPGR
ncbi:hypothetical protein [Candidatus Skiveiella danica]